MHHIFAMPDGMRFRPDVRAIAALLPDVHLVKISFVQPSPDEIHLTSDYPSTVAWVFRTGFQLKIPGVFFWKFLASIPPELQGKDGGWVKSHPFGPLSAEALMASLRQAFQMMLVSESSDPSLRAPLRATLDLDKLTADLVFPQSLEDADWQHFLHLSNDLIEDAQRRNRSRLRQIIIDGLNRPIAVMEQYEIPGGLIAQRHAFEAWPKGIENRLIVRTFLGHLSTDDTDGKPWRPTFRTLLNRHNEELTKEVFEAAIRRLITHDPAFAARIIHALTNKPADAPSSTGEELWSAFRSSRNHPALLKILLEPVEKLDGSLTLAQCLGPDLAKVNNLTDEEIVQPRSDDAQRYHQVLELVGHPNASTPKELQALVRDVRQAVLELPDRLRHLLIWQNANQDNLEHFAIFSTLCRTNDHFERLIGEFLKSSPAAREEHRPFRFLFHPLMAGKCSDLSLPAVQDALKIATGFLLSMFSLPEEGADAVAAALLLSPESLKERLYLVTSDALDSCAKAPSDLVIELIAEISERSKRKGQPDMTQTLREALAKLYPMSNGRALTGWTLLHMKAANRYILTQSARHSQRLWSHQVFSDSDPPSPPKPIPPAGMVMHQIKHALGIYLADLMDKPLVEAIQRPIDAAGFYDAFYAGNPEQARDGWERNTGSDVTTLVHRRKTGDYQLGIYRSRMYSEEARIFQVEAMLHNEQDELVAKVGYVLIYTDSTDPESLIWTFDETAHDDVREAGVGLAKAVDNGVISDSQASATVLIRDWEVRHQDRGKGIGRLLLEESLPLSYRGLGKPKVVLYKPHPLQLPAFDFSKRGHWPVELRKPLLSLKAYFQAVFAPKSALGKRFPWCLTISHDPDLHTADNTMMLAALTRKVDAIS